MAYKKDVGFAKHAIETTKNNVIMSTGGGEPIPKGQKWATETRVLQPRDPETGKFTQNVDAGLARKYRYHAERNGSLNNAKTIPLWARELVPAFIGGMKKGATITAEGQQYVSTIDLKPLEIERMVENYYEMRNEKGEIESHLFGDVAFLKYGNYDNLHKPKKEPTRYSEEGADKKYQKIEKLYPHAVEGRQKDFEENYSEKAYRKGVKSGKYEKGNPKDPGALAPRYTYINKP